jgi:hypothetical protein
VGSVSWSASYEQRVGDPWTGPLGYPATVEADERAEPLHDGLALLRELNLTAEFVRLEAGGRLSGVIDVLRTVCRHEPGLAFGYGATRLAAALALTGHSELLKDGRVGYSGRGDVFCVDEWPGALDVQAGSLNGSRQALSVSDTDLLVTHTPVGEALVETPEFAEAPPMVGLRGAAPVWLTFKDRPFETLETTADTVAAVTRIVLPGMAVGILDTGLRATLRHVLQRRIYGGTVADIPSARAVLTEAYADLLLCDAMVQQSSPEIVPRLLLRAMNRLSTVLGAHFYVRNGHVSVFQKLLRDLQTAFAIRPATAPPGVVVADPMLNEAFSFRLGDKHLPDDLGAALYADLLDHHNEDRTLDLAHRKRGT